MIKNIIVKPIEFETIKQYWIEVDHFKDPNKRIEEIIKTLGPHITQELNPRRIAYGLFNNDMLIGATQLVHWSDNLIRYRTINIRSEYRGKDLGWYLLETAWNLDWIGQGNLFGWVRDTHYDWAIKHNFTEMDKHWTGDHIAMSRVMP